MICVGIGLFVVLVWGACVFAGEADEAMERARDDFDDI